ncbi:MAG: dihydrodipicolinate synthase family protein, partial [Dehalococcoidia bacterium]
MATADSARSRLRGVIAPTVTPFDDNGAISIPGVHRMVDSLAEAGVEGIIPADLIGEVLSLTLEERRAVLAESVQAAAGR